MLFTLREFAPFVGRWIQCVLLLVPCPVTPVTRLDAPSSSPLHLPLPQVVPIAIKAAFLNCGQNCASGERFIVQRAIYDKFLEQVRALSCYVCFVITVRLVTQYQF